MVFSWLLTEVKIESGAEYETLVSFATAVHNWWQFLKKYVRPVEIYCNLRTLLKLF